MHLCFGPKMADASWLVQVTADELTYNGKDFKQFVVERSAAYISQVPCHYSPCLHAWMQLAGILLLADAVVLVLARNQAKQSSSVLQRATTRHWLA